MDKKQYLDAPALVIAGLLLAFAPSLLAEPTRVHIAVNGNDNDDGSPTKPVKTFPRAMELIDLGQRNGEIILHGGTYHMVPQPVNVPKSGATFPLLIKPADGEKVVFDGSVSLTDAKPLDGHPGLFTATGDFGYRPPYIWEEDSRIRYLIAADVNAVEAYPASCALIDEKTVVFRTSDGKPPSQKNVRMGQHGIAIFLNGDQVTLRDIEFRNFNINRWSAAVAVSGKNVTVESCSAFNCFRGFMAGQESENARFVRCRATDVGGGIYTLGKDTVVEHCWLTKTRDGFMTPAYDQDDTGIQFYSPANNGGICRYNFIRGFQNGIFVKCQPGKYVVEHNTCIGGKMSERISWGLTNTDWERSSNSVYRANILVGYAVPLSDAQSLVPGAVFDENIIWSPDAEDAAKRCIEEAHKKGTGKANLIADPLFASAENDDYRLLPGSKAVGIGGDELPAGAFPVVPKGFKPASAPSLGVQVQAPAKLAGASGKLYFEREAKFGGAREFLKSMRPEGLPEVFITTNRTVGVALKGYDALAKLVKTEVQIETGKPRAFKFAAQQTIELPDRDGTYRIQLRVQNDRKLWSKTVEIPVVLARKPPRTVGPPRVLANEHGAVVIVQTDRPALSEIEFGTDAAALVAVTNQPVSQRTYSTNDGGDYVREWQTPSQVYTHVLTAPKVKPNTEYVYRLTLSDEMNNRVTTETWKFKTTGTPRVVHLAPNGEDAEDRGTEAKPLRTLQFALDRALPGDTIRLAPGLYPGSVNVQHGGVAGAPITIEGRDRMSVFLDGAKKQEAIIWLINAPHITIRNVTVRWFTDAGISADRSPHLTVTACHFINHFWAEWPVGCGVALDTSADSIIERCTFSRMEYGFRAKSSPRVRIEHNTAVANMYAAGWLISSAEGSVVQNNSFTFTGNCSLRINEPKPEAFQSLVLDYNNYAAQIRDAEGERPDVEFKSPFLYAPASKWMINYYREKATEYTNDFICSLKRWQVMTGKDAHSIFADPKYVDPANGRYEVAKDSPNIGAGKAGATIGAAGIVQP